MQVPENFEGIFISPKTWNDQRLSLQQKIIVSLMDMKLGLTTNKDFANILGISITQTSKHMSELKRTGYIKYEKISDAEIINVLKNKGDKGIGSNQCEWCGVNTIVINEHHYPVLKKDGGTETVKICSNCHTDFHQMQQRGSL